jgi:sec-independent protein translocase protein TatC
MSDDHHKNGDVEMSFWDHLEALRHALIRSIIAIVVLSVVAFFFKDFLYNQVILGPKNPDFISNKWFCMLGHLLNTDSLCINQSDFPVFNLELAGQFRNHMLITFVTGLILAMPYILTELWLFIRPALTPKERKGARGFVLVTNFLFFTGVAFGYLIIAPLAINFFINYLLSTNIENNIRLGSYIRSVVMIPLSTGVVFELPVIIYFLTKIGIVSYSGLKTYRKHAFVGAFVASAILTPPDPISQMLVALPLILLYSVSLTIAKKVEKSKIKDL